MAKMRASGKKSVSIKDVAKLAGVSVSSVSRYLNGGSNVSPVSQKKIAQAIETLNYRPSALARALVREINPAIAVVTINSSQLGPTQMLGGIESRARERGASITISVPETDRREDILNSLHMAADQNPLGIIFMYPDMVDENISDFFPLEGPYVMVTGQQTMGAHEVSLCDQEGGEIITRYLLSLGHKTVYHVAVPVRLEYNRRLQGWRKALENTGSYIPDPIICGWDPEDAREIGRRLALNDDVTAVFAGNDELAIGLISGLRDMGKRVPDDVSVAGFDDHPLSGFWDPGLTTIHQEFIRAGRESVDLLLRQIPQYQEDVNSVVAGESGEETGVSKKSLDIHGKLVIRNSTGAPHKEK
ncbi:LacI family DNA-binding transcriptional regulator [Bifidobacterium imperatoris]|uniref:LacI family DNA-binding transcriptional regulator n=2 Tax=Bifidobacterium imperatoris TaxID=2020965 RepID=A0ABX7S3G6_9BIFI|nr:LacI family DNA-binding transcriptional regulator [Bifidobacterium imperatoris]QSY58241.1 LacI family DNA-binding transcriptional regulator [Bifidobacterium imperatoris]